MRLGDLDRIAQDVRENNIGNYYKQDWTSSQVVTLLEQVITLLENASTIDPVHAAGGCYCRECICATRPGDNLVYCDNLERDMMPDDFCSVGAKKEADHD